MTTLESAPASDTALETSPTNTGGFIESLDSFFDSVDNQTSESNSSPVIEEAKPTTQQEKPQESSDTLGDIEFEGNAKDWTPQAARRFKELKAELKTYKAKESEWEQTHTQTSSRLQELEALANNPEFDHLRTQVESYEQQMIVTKLEQSQAYQSLVEKPLMSLVGEADAIATKYHVNGNELLDVIAMNDESLQEEKLAEVLSSASDRDKYRIYKIIEEVKPILEQRRVLQENAKAALAEAEQLDLERGRHSLAQKVQQRQEAANSVANKLRDKVSFLSNVDGLDLNQIAKEAAQIDPSALDHVNSTYQAMAAKILPKMVSHYMTLQKEVDSLTSRLADFDRATPKAGGGTVNSGSRSGSQVSDGKSFVDAIAAAFGS